MLKKITLIILIIICGIYTHNKFGHIEITWQNWIIESSIGVITVALVLAILLPTSLWSKIVRIDEKISNRRKEKKWLSCEKGLILTIESMLSLIARNENKAIALANIARKEIGDIPEITLCRAIAEMKCGNKKVAHSILTNLSQESNEIKEIALLKMAEMLKENSIEENHEKLAEELINFSFANNARIEAAHLFIKKNKWQEAVSALNGMSKSDFKGQETRSLYSLCLAAASESMNLSGKEAFKMAQEIIKNDISQDYCIWVAVDLMEKALKKNKAEEILKEICFSKKNPTAFVLRRAKLKSKETDRYLSELIDDSSIGGKILKISMLFREGKDAEAISFIDSDIIDCIDSLTGSGAKLLLINLLLAKKDDFQFKIDTSKILDIFSYSLWSCTKCGTSDMHPRPKCCFCDGLGTIQANVFETPKK